VKAAHRKSSVWTGRAQASSDGARKEWLARLLHVLREHRPQEYSNLDKMGVHQSTSSETSKAVLREKAGRRPVKSAIKCLCQVTGISHECRGHWTAGGGPFARLTDSCSCI